VPDDPTQLQNVDTSSGMNVPSGAMAVVGAGTMGLGIAYVFAVAGWHVQVVEPSDEQARRMAVEHRAAAEGAVRRGKLTAEAAEHALARIARVSAVDLLAPELPLIVESVPERVELKQSVLRAIEQRRPNIIGTNTSSISIGVLAGVLDDPTLLIGTHFFNPVWSLPLVELVVSAHTSARVVADSQSIVATIGKQSILAKDVPGFATSRLDFAAALEAMRMFEDGVASADDIDRAAVLAYRHPVGPLRLSDIVGLDVRLDIARQLENEYGERFRPPAILIEMVERGDLGRKSGRGFHLWTEIAE
jgi:3-hydroxybutyryl-CoA dehydrogenase